MTHEELVVVGYGGATSTAPESPPPTVNIHELCDALSHLVDDGKGNHPIYIHIREVTGSGLGEIERIETTTAGKDD
ncbi:hypothetical protein [Cupriavidus basilensis]